MAESENYFFCRIFAVVRRLMLFTIWIIGKLEFWSTE